MIARILLLWTSRLLRSRHSAIAADVDLILKALKESSSHDQTTKEESEPSNRVEASAEAQEAQAQLFQTYKEWSDWAFSVPMPDSSTREGARIKILLGSNDPKEVMEGFHLARLSGSWDSWTRKLGMPHTKHLDEKCPCFEELLRQGGRTSRYDDQFNPITLMAMSIWPDHDKLLRNLLDQLLAIGADINDEDLRGSTILDHYVAKSKFSIDDVEHLLALGANPNQQMIEALEKSEATSAPDCISLLKAAMRKPSFQSIAQEVRPHGLGMEPRRAI